MTFGDAGAREIPSGQETVGSHTRTDGGQKTSPPGGEAPCGESTRRREIPGRRNRKKSVSRPARKNRKGKKKKRKRPGSGTLKKTVEREKKKKETKREKKLKKEMIFSLSKTISHYFPDLYDRIGELEDCRKRRRCEPKAQFSLLGRKQKFRPGAAIFALPFADNIRGVRKWSRRRNFRSWAESKNFAQGLPFLHSLLRTISGECGNGAAGGIFALGQINKYL